MDQSAKQEAESLKIDSMIGAKETLAPDSPPGQEQMSDAEFDFL